MGIITVYAALDTLLIVVCERNECLILGAIGILIG